MLWENHFWGMWRFPLMSEGCEGEVGSWGTLTSVGFSLCALFGLGGFWANTIRGQKSLRATEVPESPLFYLAQVSPVRSFSLGAVIHSFSFVLPLCCLKFAHFATLIDTSLVWLLFFLSFLIITILLRCRFSSENALNFNAKTVVAGVWHII